MRKLLALMLMTTAGAASAQDADWAYKATFYGWFPGLSSDLGTPYGSVDASVSASDVLSSLDMAFMGTFSAQHGKWGFAGDLMYSDLSASQASPFGRLFGEATYKQKLTALSGYALYRVSNDSAAKFDVGAGFRAFDLSANLSFSPGRRVTPEERDASKSWIVPLLAARFSAPINDKWFLEGFADIGGTGSDDQTWQVYGGVGYKIDENWSTQAGYRYMNFNQSVGQNGLGDLSVDMDGVLFAVTYSF
jgi:opacity protein-like surface antigen